MNPTIELNLAMLLFLPWFAILGGLFWWYPRAPRTPARRWFDIASLVLATLAAVLGTWWSYWNADLSVGNLWRQLLASTISYGLFLGVMLLAIWIRHRTLILPNRAPPATMSA
ncbi:hypothetical protein [Arenimonas sp. MALMAid1274]|uniref:hypothetical protein n=1 Tax=Arenimonas sp. MALMAid1274 TaxID=3411630 RepID=UPI003BA1036C